MGSIRMKAPGPYMHLKRADKRARKKAKAEKEAA